MARNKKSTINGLGDRLRLSRESRGWRQIDVAAELEISEATVSCHESERAEPDLTDLVGYSTMYGVSTDYLLKGEILDGDPFEGLGLVGKQMIFLIMEIFKGFRL